MPRNFVKDFEEGKRVEDEVLQLLTSKGIPCEKGDGKIADLMVYGKITEVKFDRMSAKTKNLAFELYNTKQKSFSGLKSSDAVFWVHVSYPNFLIIKTNVLNELIKSMIDMNIGSIKRGGDNNSMIYLAPKETISVHFKDIVVTNEEELKEFLSC